MRGRINHNEMRSQQHLSEISLNRDKNFSYKHMPVRGDTHTSFI